MLVAIAITTAMDASGLSAFSALPLLPLTATFWYLERHSRRSMGFAWGRWPHYVAAALYPVLVLGAIAIASMAGRAVDISETDWTKALLNIALVTISTVLVAILTEEGFFRGWLWASLQQAEEPPVRILAWTSLGFALWHASAVTLPTGFDLPVARIPVFLVNAAVLGAVWGVLRWVSGSVVVASLSHGVWNGMTYVLFGYGTKVGALGIKNTAVFGPEVGVAGLGVNLVGLAALWWLSRAHRSDAA